MNNITTNARNATNNVANRLRNTANKVSNKVVQGGGGSWVTYIIMLLIAAFMILLLVLLIQYLRTSCPPPGKLPFYDYAMKLDPRESVCQEPEPVQQYDVREEKDENEPWLLDDQIYTYDEAFQKCAAYNSSLATRNQLMKAYNNGMQAPYYGWTKDGNAYQVMQPCDYDRLVREGRDPAPPGVQGGKFPEHIRFGAWCYGVKPAGEIVTADTLKCPTPSVCQRNPNACKQLESDRIAPFVPRTQWSMWGTQ